jgi:hypothetical protein
VSDDEFLARRRRKTDREKQLHHEGHEERGRNVGGSGSPDFVVPAWSAGTQVDMDVSGRILRTWMPAIHAGTTQAKNREPLNIRVGSPIALAVGKTQPLTKDLGKPGVQHGKHL